MRVLFKLISITLMLFWAGTAAFAQQTHPLEGVWLTKDGESKVKIAACKDTLCNEIIWLKVPNDRYGKPLMDKLNKNPKLRSRPILGVPILLNMKQVNKTMWKGRLYKPRHGKSYPGHVRVLDENKLEVKGCHETLPICKTQYWKRVISAAGDQASQ